MQNIESCITANDGMAGKQSVIFSKPVYLTGYVSIVGQKEGQGPLGKWFDEIIEDPMVGRDTWEEAESELQARTVSRLLEKSQYKKEDIRYIFAGDLLGQLIATSFGLEKYDIPVFGLYGACSTMAEAMSLASVCVSSGYADNVIALASSHFASAEKQFRYPLEYGNQRALASTWTVTGCGAVILSSRCNNAQNGRAIRITAMTTGKIVDYGVKDSMNMGACMAPAAADLIASNFTDLNVTPDFYDLIVTGDLGSVGKQIVLQLLKEKGYDISNNYMDCGIEIFDSAKQDTKAGGSGCGCSAVTLCSYLLGQMYAGHYQRILFVPTGALLSTVSYNEGKSVPGIAHGVVLECVNPAGKEAM